MATVICRFDKPDGESVTLRANGDISSLKHAVTSALIQNQCEKHVEWTWDCSLFAQCGVFRGIGDFTLDGDARVLSEDYTG